MPSLSWIGKDKILTHHLDVPFKVTNAKYGFSSKDPESVAINDSENMIIHGDNLEALKSIMPKYEGNIDCIYIDPPYNTGNESWVYNDNVNDPHIKKWLGQAVGNEADDLSRHDKWLCMMYPRLALLRQLLSEIGVIFIAIDDNEQAHLKLLCDEIFGRSNFVAQFIWRGGKRNLAKWVSISHEYMLLYAKDLNACSQKGLSWKEKKDGVDDIYKAASDAVQKANGDYKQATQLLKEWYKKLPENHPSREHAHYCQIDSVGVYCMDNVSRVGGGKYSVISPVTGNVIQPPSRGWTYGKEEDFWAAYRKGIIEFTDKDTLPIFKRYLKDNETQLLETVFYKDRRGSSQRLRELMGGDYFPFPKDEEILTRFFRTFTQKNSIILDCFAGSGTTAHAVLKLNKEDGGHRQFILCEMCDYADTITAERVKRVIKGSGTGAKAIEGTGGAFNFYELGEPIFNEDNNLNENVGEDKIREYIFYAETGHPIKKTRAKDDKYYLGSTFGVAYYFIYEPNRETVLSLDSICQLKQSAESYVIYADICTIPESYLAKHNIVFKQIPRDIKHF